ncbi:helix-turn-helix domain-containing protein [Alcanivorax sp.]|uniref:helix-turn-helix domain-containing protein n=1 Tax=Alcanivorax sp. TaxID=1872427 RepID=UPI0025C68218|nr:helix-turn-helix domain-containing protein [Alcanivorax sp.]
MAVALLGLLNDVVLIVGPIGYTVKYLCGYFLMDIDPIAIGLRIREVRGNLTQARFAQELGIERKTVGRYESGDRIPDALALLRLQAAFGADPAWILNGTGGGLDLSDDERELLSLYRSAGLSGKMAAVGALQGAVSADSKGIGGNQVVVKGDGNKVAGGGYHRHGPKKK